MIQRRGGCRASIAAESARAVAREGRNVSTPHSTDALIAGVGDVQRSIGRNGDRHRSVELRGRRRTAVAREALCPAAGDHRHRAADRDLNDLVTPGIRDEQIAGCVIGDAARSDER